MPDGRLDGAVAVVTGGASGIGQALAQRFADEGARAVVIVDLNGSAAQAVAAGLPDGVGTGFGVNVADETAVRELVDQVESEIGAIDLYCSNAGVGDSPGLGDDEHWQRAIGVHMMAHVYAARHALPRMTERGAGRFLVTASAAGLLTAMDSAAYSATKHASVAIAEYLAINHGDSGVRFHCLCPQGVRTPMTAAFTQSSPTLAAGAFLEPGDVADAVLDGFDSDRFLILPHPEVAEYERRRAADRDRWLGGMRRVRAKLNAQQVS